MGPGQWDTVMFLKNLIGLGQVGKLPLFRGLLGVKQEFRFVKPVYTNDDVNDDGDGSGGGSGIKQTFQTSPNKHSKSSPFNI